VEREPNRTHLRRAGRTQLPVHRWEITIQSAEIRVSLITTMKVGEEKLPDDYGRLSPTSARPVSAEVLEEARRLVKENGGVFWFRHPDATVETWEDVYLVITRLREYGGHKEWFTAQKLWKELSICR